MPINLDLAVDILAHISLEPKAWYQDTFAVKRKNTSCGTALCFAGWAAALEGYEFAWTGYDTAHAVRVPGGEGTFQIDTLAIKLLELSEAEVLDDWSSLFNSNNTYNALLRGVAKRAEIHKQDLVFLVADRVEEICEENGIPVPDHKINL